MILLIIAHLLGDWIFQSRKMAILKGQQTIEGYMACITHIFIYTGCFIILSPHQSVWFYLSIGIPHFIIDKWSLVKYWQKFRDGVYWYDSYIKEPNTFLHRVEMGFGGLRYAVEDNTIHLICIYLSYIIFI